MKLRSKTNGKIVEIKLVQTNCECMIDHEVKSIYGNPITLDSMCKEFEDYKEPKEHWFISEFGKVYSLEHIPMDKERTELLKAIGNYFETEEEAENALEKLKAWKRLKDKGFKFTGWKFTPDMKHIKGNFITIKAKIPYIVENQADLDLLFGEEE